MIPERFCWYRGEFARVCKVDIEGDDASELINAMREARYP